LDITTTGQLIELLSKYPPDTKFICPSAKSPTLFKESCLWVNVYDSEIQETVGNLCMNIPGSKAVRIGITQ